MASTATKVVIGVGCGVLLVLGGALATCAGCLASIERDKLQSAGRTTTAENPTAVYRIPDDSQAVAEIERRFKDNRKALRTYYATPEKVNQAIADIVRLTLTKVHYGENGKTKEDKALGKKAAALVPQVSQQAREMYASSVENVLIEGGMDVQVRARGPQRKQLSIAYALMSQPLVYKLENEIKLSEKATLFGFTTIIYTNGFESSLGKTWTVDLKRRER